MKKLTDQGIYCLDTREILFHDSHHYSTFHRLHDTPGRSFHSGISWGFILVFEDVILNTSIHRKVDIRIVDDKKDLHLLEG